MGHYSSCYEYDEKQRTEKQFEYRKETLASLSEDREFIDALFQLRSLFSKLSISMENARELLNCTEILRNKLRNAE
jgi:hypothetical protein